MYNHRIQNVIDRRFIGMAKKRVSLRNLSPNMVVANDVYTMHDQLIIPQHTVLNDEIIERLKSYAIPYVIIDESAVPTSQIVSSLGEQTLSERIQESVEFREFKKVYKQQAESFKKMIDGAVYSGATLDTHELLDTSMSLLAKSRNSLHIFDILHNMHETDDITYAHSINVSLLCVIIGQWVGFPKKDLDVLCVGGLLHDVGKLLIPDSIMFKKGKLSTNEFEIIKTHTVRGYDLLNSKNLDDRIAKIALMHHERFDGTGYPLGLRGNEAEDFAKIVSIADVYDAMTATRAYRDALCPFEAIRIFEDEGLQKYDPKYMMTFLENVVSSYINNRVVLSNGMIGDIVFINKMFLSKPIIKVDDGTFLDLSKEKGIDILAIL